MPATKIGNTAPTPAWHVKLKLDVESQSPLKYRRPLPSTSFKLRLICAGPALVVPSKLSAAEPFVIEIPRILPNETLRFRFVPVTFAVNNRSEEHTSEL